MNIELGATAATASTNIDFISLLRRKTGTTLSKSDIEISVPMSIRTENDLRWDGLFASTSSEQWEKLERLFMDDVDDDTPLDFTNR